MAEKTPLISIVMPVYNTSKYLIKSVEAVLNQSYQNIELLLVDDGSKDDSYEKCRILAPKDDRIILYRKENGGAGDARNYALDRVNGEYIIFVDSDDIIENNLIESSYRLLTEKNADICIFNYDCIDENGVVIDDGSQNPIQEGIFTSNQIFEKTYEKNGYMYALLCNKLIKRQLLEKLRFPKMKMCEDEILFPRLIIQCEKIVCTTKILYHYLIRPGSIMHDSFSLKQLDQLRAYYDRADFYYRHKKKKLAMIASKEYWDNFRVKYIRYDLQKEKEYLLDVKKQFNKLTCKLLRNKKLRVKEKLHVLMMRISPMLYKKYILSRSK